MRALAEASAQAWPAILARDLPSFAQHFRDSFAAQVNLFPSMLNEKIEAVIECFRGQALAWKLAGAGGGGYLALVAEKPIPGAMRLHIRRRGME